jgi:hypothetical protein
MFGQDVAGTPLMVRIHIGVQKADRDRLDAFCFERRHHRFQRDLVQFGQSRPVGRHPFRHRQTQVTRD